MWKTTRTAPQLIPAGLPALAAGANSATIRKWASCGKIRRSGTPRKALYDLDELMVLVCDRGGDSPSRSSAGGFTREADWNGRR